MIALLKNKNGEVRDAQLHQSDRGTPRDQTEPDWNDSLYRFNFLTQRVARGDWRRKIAMAGLIDFLPDAASLIALGPEDLGMIVLELAQKEPGGGNFTVSNFVMPLWSANTPAYSKEANDAEAAAKAIFETRGNAPRLFSNTLVFLALDKVRLQDLD